MWARIGGQDYVRSRIYMTAVDTGWINDEKPLPQAQQHFQVCQYVQTSNRLLLCALRFVLFLVFCAFPNSCLFYLLFASPHCSDHCHSCLVTEKHTPKNTPVHHFARCRSTIFRRRSTSRTRRRACWTQSSRRCARCRTARPASSRRGDTF